MGETTQTEHTQAVARGVGVKARVAGRAPSICAAGARGAEESAAVWYVVCERGRVGYD